MDIHIFAFPSKGMTGPLFLDENGDRISDFALYEITVRCDFNWRLNTTLSCFVSSTQIRNDMACDVMHQHPLLLPHPSPTHPISLLFNEISKYSLVCNRMITNQCLLRRKTASVSYLLHVFSKHLSVISNEESQISPYFL